MSEELSLTDLALVQSKKDTVNEFSLKITPEKLIIPSSGHLDVQITNPDTGRKFLVSVILTSLSLEITRVWYMKDGKEEVKRSQPDDFCHMFEDDKKTVYFRISHAKTLVRPFERSKRKEKIQNPFLNPLVSLDTPEGSVKIECFEEFESESELSGWITSKWLELSAESKSLEVKEKFLEFQKNQKRRNRLKKIVLEDEVKEKEKMVEDKEYPSQRCVNEAKKRLKEKRDNLNEKVFFGKLAENR
uniref:Major sperm protein n=1 Tax=Caenorhabditis tropicalis TaxID=1561998 RepID=A0A1I7TGF8_9PELO